MNEIFVHKYIYLNDNDVKIVKVYYIIEVCMIMKIFSMHKLIVVIFRLLLGSQPTCQQDQKSCMANHVIFRF